MSSRYNYQAAHDIAKPLDSLTSSDQNAVLVDVCRKIKAAANPVGPAQEELPDAAGPLNKTAPGGRSTADALPPGVSDIGASKRKLHGFMAVCKFRGQRAILKKTSKKLCQIDALKKIIDGGHTLEDRQVDHIPTRIISPIWVGADETCVMEIQPFVDGITLKQVIDRSHPYKVRGSFLGAIFASLLTVVDRLHQLGVLHRDVCPSNILISCRDCKLQLWLIDCSFACMIESTSQSHVYDPCYSAPEQIAGRAYRQSDWYSIASTCFFLANGRPPVPQDEKDLHEGLKNMSCESFKAPGGLEGPEFFEALLQTRLSDRPQDFWEIKLNQGSRAALMHDSPLTAVLDLGKFGHLFLFSNDFASNSDWKVIQPGDLSGAIDEAERRQQIRTPGLRCFLQRKLKRKGDI